MKRALYWLGYAWAFPVTLAGLLLCWVSEADLQVLTKDWVFMFVSRGSITRWWFNKGFTAFTWGAVICLDHDSKLVDTRLLKHELRHFQQCRWLGPFAPIAYGLASLVAVLRGRNAYRDNWFERDARDAETGGH